MSKKRRMMLIAGLVMSMGTASTLGAVSLSGCIHADAPVADVTGVYYVQDGEDDCVITLNGSEFTFEMTLSGESKSGEYTYDGTNLNLTIDGNIIVAELNSDGVLSVSYNGKDYVLRKTDSAAYKVTYKDGDSTISSLVTISGKTVKAPADPVKTGYIFMGWYDSSSLKTPFNFDKAITSDTTVYAYFEQVDVNVKNYQVKFDLNYDGAPEAEEVTTVNGKIYDLPTPQREGATFLGWWASDYQSADKLTYKYTDQVLDEDTTLFAVWSSNVPAFSVTSSGVTIENGSVGSSYAITIYDADNKSVFTVTTGATVAAFDFASKDAGDYKIEVKSNGKTAVGYFKNKALARPSGLKIEGDTLSFGAVEGATEYLLTIVCGNEEHVHTDLSLGTKTSYDFSACEMKEDGISFTVKAKADGRATSVSDEKVLIRNLSALKGLSVDAATETLSWDKVDNATGYKLVIKQGSAELYNGLTADCEFSLRNYDAGKLEIEVVPVAHGYNSPKTEQLSYSKASLATPDGVKVNGYIVSWDEVKGASAGYTVKVNGKTYDVNSTSFDLSSVASGQNKLTLSVSAKAAQGSKASAYTDEITFDAAINSVDYKSGTVNWNAVLGAVKYGVQVGDAQEVIIADGSISADIAFTASGNTSIKINAYNSDGIKIGSTYELKIMIYAVNFNTNGGNAVETVYLAKGDMLILPEAVYAGYDLDGWYDVQGGATALGKKMSSGIFNGSSDVTYYAYWLGKEFNVDLSVGAGATIDSNNTTVRFGKDFTLPVPSHSDTRFAFGGWYTEANGQGTVLTDFSGKSITSWNRYTDVTLYAYWLEIYTFNELNDGTYSVSKGTQATIASVTEITIPATYNGKSVSTVEGAAFQSCTNLKVVNIPNTIQLVATGTQGGNMAGSAFQSCTKLEEVNIYEVEGYTGEKFYESSDGVLIYHRPTTGETEIAYYPYAKTGEYVIPDGVTTIPINVFRGCPVEKVTIPASVTYIGDYAFYAASSSNNKLTEVVFTAAKDGETEQPLTLGDQVFKSCSKLLKVTLPARLAQLSHEKEENGTTTTVKDDFYDLFTGCSKLAEVYVDGKGTAYSSTEDGLILSADGKSILYCPVGRVGDYTITAGVTTIGERAFYGCTKLTGITVPSYITEIKKEAFYGCTGLKSVNFLGEERDADLVIREKAFYRCTSSGFTRVVLPANLTVLEKNAFGYCTYLKTVTVNCTREKSEIQYASSAFNRTEADNGTSTVVTVNIGAKVNAFDINGVFGGAGNKLTTVNVDPANENYASVNGVLFNKDITEILFYPSKRTDTTYTLPATVKRIGGNVFAGITAFTSIEIGVNVEEIAEGAFQGCTNLKEITFADGRTKALTIGENAFEDCSSLTVITLPEMTESIAAGAFSGCSALEEVNLPASLKTLGSAKEGAASVFDGCVKFSNINIASGNSNFASADGVLCGVNKGVVESVLYSPICNSGDSEGVVNLPSTIKEIAASAFAGNTYIKEIKFAQNTTVAKVTIGEKAFYKCTALEKVNLPTGLETIETLLFYGCSSLKEVSIPYTVKTIKVAAFAQCKALETLTFDETPTGKTAVALTIANGTTGSANTGTVTAANEIKQGAFANTMSLKEVVFPERLTTIGNYAFYYSGVTAVYIPSTVTAVGTYAFRYCTSLNTAVFAASANNVTLNNYAFSNCDLLAKSEGADGKATGLVLPTKLKTLGTYVFAYNKNLTAVELPNYVTAIGNYTFAYCDALESIVLPDSVTTLGGYMFRDDISLKSVTFPNNKSFIKIDSYTFYGCKSLNNVTIPDTVTTINGSAFYGCTALTDINLGNGLKTLETSAFSGCTALESITIPASIQTINGSAFADCTLLKEVNFAVTDREVKGEDGTTYTEKQSDLKQLGNTIFKNTALTSFTFPISSNAQGIVTKNNITSSSMFEGCTQLTTVNLSRSVSSILQMFDGCHSITTISIAQDSKNLSSSSKYNPDGTPLIFNSDGTTIKLAYGVAIASPGTYVIPEGITAIDAHAFKNQNNIISLVLPSTLTSIGDYAFQNCRMLQSIKFNVGAAGSKTEGSTSITKIGLYAFNSCLSLKYITVGDGTENVLPSTLAEIGDKAFYKCSNLETITVPQSVTKMGTNVFDQCIGLETVYHLSTAIGNYDYEFCTNLKTVYLNSKITNLGTYVFQYCKSLDTVKLYNVSNNTVEGKDGEVTLPSVTSLANYAFKYSTGIKVINIPSTLTTLGNYVFDGCTNLTTVVFDKKASGVKLGDYLFRDNTSLKNIVNPECIVEVGTGSFNGCAGIVNLSLPKCTKIGNYAFSGCTSLTEISIPACETIGDYAFGYKSGTSGTPAYYACNSLKKVVLGTDSKLNIKIGQCAFGYSVSVYSTSTEEEIELEYRQKTCYSLQDINLDRVVSVGSTAFAGCNFTEVSLPACTEFASKAFIACRYLTKVNLSTTQDVTLADYVFGYTGELTASAKLKEINLEKVVSVGYGCFMNCLSLSTVNLPNCTFIGRWAFEYCEGLTEITLNPDVEFETYNGVGAFASCINLKTVHGALKNIKQQVFYKCYALTDIDLSQAAEIGYAAFEYCESLQGNLDLSSIATLGEFAFDRCSGITSVTLGSGITSLPRYAFQLCTNLKTINLDSILEIDNYAFNSCESLEGTLDLSALKQLGENSFRNCANIREVIFGNNLKEIPARAFYGCDSLVSVDIPGSVSSIGSGAFFSSGLSGELTLIGVTSVGADAFAATNIDKVIISDYVTEIGIDAFGQCKNLTAFEVSEDNQWFMADKDGVLYAKANAEEQQTLICYPAGKSGDVVIPSNTAIAPYAFAGCYNVTSITIPSDVTEISEHAFWYFRGTVNFTIPDTVTAIKDGAFQGTLISKITLPDGVKTIGASAFRSCENLTEIIIPDGVESIGDYAFAGTSIEKIVIPASVKSIGAHAFDGCVNLASVTFNVGLQSIGADAFAGCEKLTSIYIPDNVESIGDYAFEKCTGLTSAVFGKNIGTLGTSAFYGCTELTTVTFGDNFGTIGVGAFSRKYKPTTSFTSATGVTGEETYLEKLTTVIFEGTVKQIGVRAFSYSGLTEITLPEGLENLGNYAFAECQNLKKATILRDVGTYNEEGKLTSGFGAYEFYKCPALEQVTIAEGVTTIGKNCFSYSGNARTVISLPDTIEQIPDYTFYQSGIASIKIPETVTRIGTWAFYNCTALEEVNIPSGVTYIGDYAFTNTAIKKVVVPALTTSGDYLFKGCTNLSDVTLTEGLKIIACQMFYNCTALTSITIPSSVTTWRTKSDQYSTTACDAFYGTNLTSVTLTEGLTVIGQGAFRGSKISELTLPSSLKTLETKAFLSCEYLTKINIPASVTSIGTGVFSGCTNLTSVEFEEGCTKIYTDMFAGCTSIKTLVIPDTIVSVAAAFTGWTSDQTIIIKTTDGFETAVVENSSYWILGWLQNCGAKIIVQTPSSANSSAEGKDGE